uniref:Uncharacterized protein n=1 Tax=Arundo donax TaxID=35708 RepID=A0A0A9BU76_ARUDO
MQFHFSSLILLVGDETTHSANQFHVNQDHYHRIRIKNLEAGHGQIYQ